MDSALAQHMDHRDGDTEMTLSELADLIRRVPDGCSVQMTTIYQPGAPSGDMLYGAVYYGKGKSARTFHGVAELIEVLRRIAK